MIAHFLNTIARLLGKNKPAYHYFSAHAEQRFRLSEWDR